MAQKALEEEKITTEIILILDMSNKDKCSEKPFFKINFCLASSNQDPSSSKSKPEGSFLVSSDSSKLEIVCVCLTVIQACWT